MSVAPPTASATASRALVTRSLPKPRLRSDVSLEEVIALRESVRGFTSELLRIEDISQLLWAAQGMTRSWGARSAPSAGALYPLELYLVTPEGLSRYLPDGHRLALVTERDLRAPLSRAALAQSAVEHAPAIVAITAVHARSRIKYGRRAVRYATLEAGHVAQNLLLQAVALGLGAVPIGAFDDEEARTALELPRAFAPLYLVAVGHPATPR